MRMPRVVAALLEVTRIFGRPGDRRHPRSRVRETLRSLRETGDLHSGRPLAPQDGTKQRERKARVDEKHGRRKAAVAKPVSSKKV